MLLHKISLVLEKNPTKYFFYVICIVVISCIFFKQINSASRHSRAVEKASSIDWMGYENLELQEFILISLCISFYGIGCWFSKWKTFMHDSPRITHCIFNLRSARGNTDEKDREKKHWPSKWCSFSNKIIFHAFFLPSALLFSIWWLFAVGKNFLFLLFTRCICSHQSNGFSKRASLTRPYLFS